MRGTHSLIAAHVGRRLKNLRGGYRQNEFAARLGLNQAQYNRYEVGKRLAPDSVIQKVADTCGLDPEQVIWGECYGETQRSRPPLREFVDSVSQMVRLLDTEALFDVFMILKDRARQLETRRKQQVQLAEDAMAKLGPLAD